MYMVHCYKNFCQSTQYPVAQFKMYGKRQTVVKQKHPSCHCSSAICHSFWRFVFATVTSLLIAVDENERTNRQFAVSLRVNAATHVVYVARPPVDHPPCPNWHSLITNRIPSLYGVALAAGTICCRFQRISVRIHEKKLSLVIPCSVAACHLL